MELFKKIGGDVNVSGALSSLEEKRGMWLDITGLQKFKGSPHFDTETIFLRWAKDQSEHAAFNEIDAIDYPALDEVPIFRDLIGAVSDKAGCESLGRAIVVSLRPGGVITKHIDEGVYADHYERFHLVLESKMGNTFYASRNDQEGEFANCKQGEIWWFNHKKPHWFHNFSKYPRIHLIVDCVAKKYRMEREPWIGRLD